MDRSNQLPRNRRVLSLALNSVRDSKFRTDVGKEGSMLFQVLRFQGHQISWGSDFSVMLVTLLVI